MDKIYDPFSQASENGSGKNPRRLSAPKVCCKINRRTTRLEQVNSKGGTFTSTVWKNCWRCRKTVPLIFIFLASLQVETVPPAYKYTTSGEMCIWVNNLFRHRKCKVHLQWLFFFFSLSARLSFSNSISTFAAGAGGLLASAVPACGLRVYCGARGRVLSPLCHRPLPGRHHPQRHHQDMYGRAQHLTLQRLLLD